MRRLFGTAVWSASAASSGRLVREKYTPQHRLVQKYNKYQPLTDRENEFDWLLLQCDEDDIWDQTLDVDLKNVVNRINVHRNDNDDGNTPTVGEFIVKEFEEGGKLHDIFFVMYAFL